jgi:hypothetical protein
VFTREAPQPTACSPLGTSPGEGPPDGGAAGDGAAGAVGVGDGDGDGVGGGRLLGVGVGAGDQEVVVPDDFGLDAAEAEAGAGGLPPPVPDQKVMVPGELELLPQLMVAEWHAGLVLPSQRQ